MIVEKMKNGDVCFFGCFGNYNQFIVDYKDCGNLMSRIYVLSKKRNEFISPLEEFSESLFWRPLSIGKRRITVDKDKLLKMLSENKNCEYYAEMMVEILNSRH